MAFSKHINSTLFAFVMSFCLGSCSLILGAEDEKTPGSGTEGVSDSGLDSSDTTATPSYHDESIIDGSIPLSSNNECPSLSDYNITVPVVSSWEPSEDCGIFSNMMEQTNDRISTTVAVGDGSITLRLPPSDLSAEDNDVVNQIQFGANLENKMIDYHQTATQRQNFFRYISPGKTCFMDSGQGNFALDETSFLKIETRLVDEGFEVRYSVQDSTKSNSKTFKIVRFDKGAANYNFSARNTKGNDITVEPCQTP